jgi:hypothetical protein
MSTNSNQCYFHERSLPSIVHRFMLVLGFVRNAHLGSPILYPALNECQRPDIGRSSTFI